MKQLLPETMRKWYETGYKLHNWPVPDWNDLASEDQVKLFFALCNELHHNVYEVKERAKKSLRLFSFSHITKTQIAQLIEKLQLQIRAKQEGKNEGVQN